jgi:MerR family transcriptional regulator, light-induced transcriptional regulator
VSYRVKTVCSMVGIPRPTLLAWERRYRILDPVRSPSGHRLYTDEDVALLRRLKRLVDDGYAISEAVELQRSGRTAPPTTPTPTDPAGEEGRPDVVLLEALLAFDRHEADRLLGGLRQLSFRQAIDDLYVPILREVGDRWAEGRISVAQEHFVTGWCREQLFAMFHVLGSGPATGPTAVCALAPGERHELGLLAIAIHLMLAGWRVTWLGADLPIDELCDYVAAERPRLVCLSTMVGAEPVTVRAWARQLRGAAPPSTVVALGGSRTRVDHERLVMPGVVVCETGDELLAAVQDAGQ